MKNRILALVGLTVLSTSTNCWSQPNPKTLNPLPAAPGCHKFVGETSCALQYPGVGAGEIQDQCQSIACPYSGLCPIPGNPITYRTWWLANDNSAEWNNEGEVVAIDTNAPPGSKASEVNQWYCWLGALCKCKKTTENSPLTCEVDVSNGPTHIISIIDWSLVPVPACEGAGS
jgi:hypothetical protein